MSTCSLECRCPQYLKLYLFKSLMLHIEHTHHHPLLYDFSLLNDVTLNLSIICNVYTRLHALADFFSFHATLDQDS